MSQHHRQYSSRRWESVRLQVLERDSWACRDCGDYGNQVDHRIPIFQGGDFWDPDNLQTLCAECHRIKTNRDLGREIVPGRQDFVDFARKLFTC